MGLMDKAKSAAGQATALAKSGAEQAKEKAQELQTKRDLDKAYTELGKKAYELAAANAISHTDLTPLVDRCSELLAELEAAGASDDGASDEAASDEPAPTMPTPTMPTPVDKE